MAHRSGPKNHNYKTRRRKTRGKLSWLQIRKLLRHTTKNTSNTETKYTSCAPLKLTDIGASKDTTRKYIELYKTLKIYNKSISNPTNCGQMFK